MTTTIKLADVDIGVARGEAHLRSLEEQLGRTVSRSDGLKAALIAAQRAVDESGGAVERLASHFRAADAPAQTLYQRLHAIGQIDVVATGRRWAQAWHAPLQVAQQLGGAIVGTTRALAESAIGAEQHQRALRQLGSAYHLVQQATNDTVSAEQAARAQQTLMQSGLRLSGQELATITRAAREYAVATGTDATQALEQLTDALRGGEREGLQRFGVGLREGQTRGQAFDSAMRQLTSTQRGHTPVARSLGEEMTRLGRTVTEATGAITNFIATRVGLTGLFASISQGIQQVMREAPDFLDFMQRAAGGQIRDMRNATSNANYTAAMGRADEFATRFGVQHGGFGRAYNLTDNDREQITAEMQALEGRLGRTNSDEERAAIVREMLPGIVARSNGRASAGEGRHAAERNRGMLDQLTTGARMGGAEGTPRDHSGAGGAANDNAEQLNELKERVRDARAEAQMNAGHMADEGREHGETQAHYLQRLIDLNHNLAEAARRVTEQETAAAAAASERTRGLASSITGGAAQGAATEGQEGAANDNAVNDELYRQNQAASASVQFAESFELGAARTQTAAQQMAGGVRAAFNTITGAVRTHIGALLEGRETAGEAFRGIAHEAMMALALESGQKAIFEGAQAIAAAATYRYAEAGMHATAAGIYGGLAIAGGIGAALTNAPAAGAAAPSGGSAFASAGRGAGSDSGGGGSVVYQINYSSLVHTTEREQEVLNEAMNAGNRRGLRTHEDRTLRRAAGRR